MGRVPPPEVMAKWPKPNYENPQSRGHWLISVEMILFAFTLVVVSLRVYTRGWMIRSFGTDDWLIVAATLVCGGLTTATCLATVYGGYGLHIWDVRPHLRGISLRFAWANMMLFTICVVLTKLSILWFYLRLASTKAFRVATWGFIMFVALWGIAFIIALCLLCIPLEAYWNPAKMDQHHCMNETAAMVSNAVFNIIADVGLIILPMPVLWRIQLPFKQRLGLLVMFGLGAIVCVAGVMRLVYMVETTTSMDPTWDGFLAWIWVAIECDVGIICASIPSLKPLVVQSRQNIRDYSSRSRNGGNSQIQPPLTGEPKQSVNAPLRSKMNESRLGRRLSRIIVPSNHRSQGATKLDSLWDASDENIPAQTAQGNKTMMISRSRSQSFHMSTFVNAEKPPKRPRRSDERDRKERKSLFMERIRGGSSSPEEPSTPKHKRGQSSPISEAEAGMINGNVIEMPGYKVERKDSSDMDSTSDGTGVNAWDVVKTTKIEVVTQTYEDGRPSVSERTLV